MALSAMAMPDASRSDRSAAAASRHRLERRAQPEDRSEQPEQRRDVREHREILQTTRQARDHRERRGIGNVLQVGLVTAATPQDEETHIRQRRVRLRAELDRVLDLARTDQLDHAFNERATVDLRPNDDRVEPLQEHGEANDRDEQDRVHDGTAVAVPLEHGVHLSSLRTSVGVGSARSSVADRRKTMATSPVRRRRRSTYGLRGAGGVPDGGRGGDGGRAVESAVDREVVSDRVPGFADMMSSGGRIDGQKS